MKLKNYQIPDLIAFVNVGGFDIRVELSLKTVLIIASFESRLEQS